MMSPTSSEVSVRSSNDTASDRRAWFAQYLGVALPPEGGQIELGGRTFMMRGGILRAAGVESGSQQQTAQTFGFKWQQRHTFESGASLTRMREWLHKRYGIPGGAIWMAEHGENPIILDAGCGAGMSAIELFGDILRRSRYLGVDISTAVDVAATRFKERGLPGQFVQASIIDLPFPQGSVDVIFSEGVLHHTDSTERAFASLAKLLKPGGRFLFYVYRKKGPLREFSDDYIRARLQSMSPEEAWSALMPLTKLGKALGELHVEIDIPEAIDLLGIPPGKIDIQRLFYWHVFKAFFSPDLTLDEMNHINFDWYAPKNAHRHTIEEVRGWCAQAGLTIERESTEESGISVVARRGTG